MIWLMVVVVALLVAINLFFLRGEDLSIHDEPRPQPVGGDRDPSSAHYDAIKSMSEMSGVINDVSRREQLKVIREYMDNMGVDVAFDGQISSVDTNGIKGEWLVPPGADTRKRVLYIHGGAWMMGSPQSHRAITTRYANITGGAVFSLDYRLMPENSRQAGIDDCRAAYRWILDNGPAGEEAATDIVISGDSAGGNLTLSLINWIRDLDLCAPTAVVALSPATDGTFTSPSMKANVATDHMLGPIFADLSKLPPTLVHVSAHEMLLDDAVRYVNKARSQGSPVELQAWNNMLHVWHIFAADMPEAQEAFAEIEAFLNKVKDHSVPSEVAA